MIISICHKEASETGANSSGVRKGALRVAFYLNSPRQTECSLGTVNQTSHSVSNRLDFKFVPFADYHFYVLNFGYGNSSINAVGM